MVSGSYYEKLRLGWLGREIVGLGSLSVNQNVLDGGYINSLFKN